MEIKQSHYEINLFVPKIAIKTCSIDEAITREVQLPTPEVCARYNIIQNHNTYYKEIKKRNHNYHSVSVTGTTGYFNHFSETAIAAEAL